MYVRGCVSLVVGWVFVCVCVGACARAQECARRVAAAAEAADAPAPRAPGSGGIF